ncbi:reverse transcriptase domain-containing protein [Serratia fonticola]|nr:reverse transcriptase domain-containing protein [Serratia fonticola]
MEDGGEIVTPEKGICRGSALSPLIGGSLLRHVDSYFATCEEVFYTRYMDDFIFFTKTRWHLRKAIKRLHEFFDLGGFETHPDKTQLGRIEHGFDWLGLWYSPLGSRIAPSATENHRERIARLYDQARRRKLSKAETEIRARVDVALCLRPRPLAPPSPKRTHMPIRCERHHLILLLAISVSSATTHAYTASGGPHSLVPNPNGTSMGFEYDWSINGDPGGNPGTITCPGTTRCQVSFFPYTGLGPVAGHEVQLCDSGGYCGSANTWPDKITVDNGTTWAQAYEWYITHHGRSGHIRVLHIFPSTNAWFDLIAWDKICITFGAKSHLWSPVVPAPGAVCQGGGREPELSCIVNLPRTLDLGSVNTGTSYASGTAYGDVQCSRSADVTASLLNRPQIDGNDVAIDINYRSMGSSAVTIGTGVNVPLMIKATITGTLRNAGSYSSDAVLQISYQ